MNLRKTIITGSILLGTLFFLSHASADEQLDEFTKALTSGKVKLNVRLRFEDVDDDAAGLRSAELLSLRTRLGYETGDFRGFKLFGEMEDIREVASIDDYNDGPNGNGMTEFALIPDPEETELNQLYLQYGKDYGKTNILIRHGRERQKWDNDRFIGNVGWRQNEQTYDGTSLVLGFKELGLTVRYAHHTNVNRIFGDQAETVGDFNVDSHNFNVNFNKLKFLNATAYYYDWESDEPATNGGGFGEDDDRETYGVRTLWNFPVGQTAKLLGTVEYASQDDSGSAENFSSVDYTLFEAGVGFKLGSVPLTIKVGQETLEGNLDDGESFITPFATLHAFQGWADKFLLAGITGIYGGAGAAGIEDTYVSVGTSLWGTKLLAVYHEYEPDESGTGFSEYGTELNLLAVKKFGKHYTLGAKYADFSEEDDFTSDTEKLWIWGQINF
ncbi:MAG: alginate export family protein [Pseudomonadota bacterium]